MSKFELFQSKWWGWGSKDTRLQLTDKPGIIPYLMEKGLLKGEVKELEFQVDDIDIKPTSLQALQIEKLEHSFSKIYSLEKLDRIAHSFGKSYRDLIRLRTKSIQEAPDVVFYPHNLDDLKKIMGFCKDEGFALIPFGGGTSVVGGLDCLKGNFKGVCVVNLRYMNALKEIDIRSQMATFECGVLGPELEEKLKIYGYTLGHFPQSFEFSTLGGWIAARSSGQNSLWYGGIEEMVISLKIITPKGELMTLQVPRLAGGPSLKEILVGSEGIFGIIYEAQVRISPIPNEKKYFAVAFPSLEVAASATKQLVQEHCPLAMIRVSDELETDAYLAMAGAKNKTGPKVWIGKKMMEHGGIDPDCFALCMIGIEGTREHIEETYEACKRILKSHPHFILGTSAGEKWLHDRFRLPYLRDEMMNQGIFVETLETSTNWTNFLNLYKGVKNAIEAACKDNNVNHICYMHLSHFYETGVSLYFSILAEAGENPIELWKDIKKAACMAIVENKSSISHHHGIGVDHAKYVHTNPLETQVIKSIKKTLDPLGYFNPGKILPLE